jgi:hypothetical protein
LDGYQFHQQPLPLRAIYILQERTKDPAPFVEAVPPGIGLISLVGNTYSTHLLDKTMRANEFRSLDRLLASVPLRQVTPHADPTYLTDLCDTILRDYQALKYRAHDQSYQVNR